jgi:hypothetical protein
MFKMKLTISEKNPSGLTSKKTEEPKQMLKGTKRSFIVSPN